MTALAVRNLRAFYGRVPALHGVDLKVEEGEIVVVLGANGAGKTTLLRAVSRMVSTSGEIEFAGRSIVSMSTEAVAQRGLGHVPEGRGTFSELTVAENLRLGTLARGSRLRERADTDIDEVLTLFPVLNEMRHRQAGALSGGQQQQLGLARALLGRPTLLMLDEVSLGVAPRVTAEIFSRLDALRNEWELSILMAEQNARSSLAVADRGYVLDSGRLVAEGPAEELAVGNVVESAYLGR